MLTPKVMRGQSPLVVAQAIYAPRPVAVSVEVPQVTISETMLAFQAPPLAVIPPVTHDEKIPGTISRRSVGTLDAPAIELNKIYHCAPQPYYQHAADVI